MLCDKTTSHILWVHNIRFRWQNILPYENHSTLFLRYSHHEYGTQSPILQVKRKIVHGFHRAGGAAVPRRSGALRHEGGEEVGKNASIYVYSTLVLFGVDTPGSMFY